MATAQPRDRLYYQTTIQPLTLAARMSSEHLAKREGVDVRVGRLGVRGSARGRGGCAEAVRASAHPSSARIGLVVSAVVVSLRCRSHSVCLCVWVVSLKLVLLCYAYGIYGLQEGEELEKSEGRSRSLMPCVSSDNSRLEDEVLREVGPLLFKIGIFAEHCLSTYICLYLVKTHYC